MINKLEKLIALALSFLMVITISPAIVFAADNNNTYKEQIVISKGELESFTPEKEKEINGSKYIYSNYEILSENEMKFSIQTPGLKSKNYNAEDIIKNPENESQVGNLDSVTYQENKETNRTKIISDSKKYKTVKLDYTYPETIETTYKDKKSGKEIDAVLKIKDINKNNQYWVSSKGFKGTVSMYDSSKYYLDNSNITIPKNEEKPTYRGYENEILKSLNLDLSKYRIVDSSWAGDTYYNAEGILCRNCIYDIQALVCDSVVTYESEIDLPDIITYTATSTYIDSANSTVTLNVLYNKMEEKTNVKAVVIGVVLGIAVLAVFITVVLMSLSKRRKRQNEEIIKD